MAMTASSLLRRRLFSTTATPRANDFTHCIIGGGIIGLSIARQLALTHPSSSTLLLERHPSVGTETSSRNSEVIHAGLYYPPLSLKTRLCIRGSSLLYAYCETHHVPHKRTGKWLLAQNAAELEALQRLHEHAEGVGVRMRWVGREEVKRRQPGVSALAGVLESVNTGIVDSHQLMQSLRGGIEEAGGDVVVGAEVVGVKAREGREGEGEGGYELTVATRGEGGGEGGGEETTITADTVVNAAGLGAVAVGNLLLPPSRHRRAYFCKGTYYVPTSSPAPSPSPVPAPAVTTLLYPAPIPGHAGLGTHLTLDLSGAIRFGPDVEWVSSPEDLTATDRGMAAARAEIARYLPGVGELRPDYAGIRPKLHPQGGGGGGGGGVAGTDFWIKEEDGFKGWVNLLGIESPGLTSSLAIAEYVERILYGKGGADASLVG
ncbi:FAD dependent oxidoreductase [Tricharina praecox]|uniref:FAD dependent oxidoreductase n=1 Tax=Tricharina praecox TaxID=43433 RepID=UPI00221E43C7|nr:FAD dependent oxidoreductase [Tricharina praecox]KAI5851032.1 FAD dependent oxidoreductase [Tricharina praecox]